MTDDFKLMIERMRAHGFKMGKPTTCGNCAAFVVRDDEYRCILKPFECDDTGHPMGRCPKPLTEPNFEKVKALIDNR